MTHVTFLAHSGFLVETEEMLALFDWWKGPLPPLPPEKPLLIFVSHVHHDHFNPQIFSLNDGSRPVRFLLGEGVPAPEGRAADCTVLRGGEAVTLPEAAVETLPSTDEGVAFLVSCGGKTVYHAGDLHWWHWEGEPDPWNPRMKAAFQQYTEPLRGRRLDFAFLPLDPRLQRAESLGFLYLMELSDVRHAFPMHQWDDYTPTDRLLSLRPDLWNRVVKVSYEGQRWSFPD